MQAARKLAHYEPWNDARQTATVLPAKRRKVDTSGPAAAQVLLCALVVFALMTVVLVRYSSIAELKVSNYQLKSDLKKIELTRDELKAELDRSLDLELVESVAREQLGMQLPAQTQIIYIDRAARYTLNSAEAVEEARQNVFARWVRGLPWMNLKQASAQ